MLKILDLRKSYEDQLILSISESIIPPGIHWIQGENGAGKTTFLKILAGIIPYQGHLILEGIGEEKRNRSLYRKHVNYAEAEPQFPNFLSGTELLHFYEKVKGENDIYPELIHKFGLLDYSNKNIKTYSSGMLKKLSLVLGLVGSPKLILLDEPLITLDTQAVSHLLDILSQWMKINPELTILFTSHQAPHHTELILNRIYRLENLDLVEIKNG